MFEKEFREFEYCDPVFRTDIKPLPEFARNKDYQNLRSRIKARQPLIFIDTYDREYFDSLMVTLKSEKGLLGRVYEFLPGVGALCFENKAMFNSADGNRIETLRDFLLGDYYRSPATGAACDTVLVVRGTGGVFEQIPELAGWLRMVVANDLADTVLESNPTGEANGFRYVIIVGSGIGIPDELVPYSVRLKLSKPGRKRLETVLTDEFEKIRKRQNFSVGLQGGEKLSNGKTHDTAVSVGRLVDSLNGFSETEVRMILRYAFQSNRADMLEKRIGEAKREMVDRTDFLKLVDVNADEVQFAGLENLRKYLERVGRLARLSVNGNADIKGGIRKLKNNGLKGILLVGMPGCGKSMAAKASCGCLGTNWPLIQLDIGRLLGKYVGESERNLRTALEIAERVSPCVLWIDELEKAFSGLESSDGTALRLFGYFLTWMQEKRSLVYVIATANNVDKLPAEFKRRGRFDEIFRILLPDDEEREAIFRYHLGQIRSWLEFPKEKDDGDKAFGQLCHHLSVKTRYGTGTNTDGNRGFSGADIAAIIHSAMVNAIVSCEGGIQTTPRITQADLETEIKRVKEAKTAQRDIMANEDDGRTDQKGDAYTRRMEKLRNSGFTPASKEK